MKAVGDRSRRKRRYIADTTSTANVTPLMLVLLRLLVPFGFLTAVQLARLSSRSEQAVRRIMRAAFDLGLVDIVVVPRIALLPDAANPLSASFGSAPNIITLTAKGIRLLGNLGGTEARVPKTPTALFMRHELGVRDCVIAFLNAARSAGHAVEKYKLGADAVIDLGRNQRPKTARPDALIVYRFGERVLAAAVEFDTGSERGPARWADKLAACRLLLSGDRFAKAVGYARGRILVVCLTMTRRDQLTEFVREQADPGLAERFWLTTLGDLTDGDLSRCIWRRPGQEALATLVPPELYLETHREGSEPSA